MTKLKPLSEFGVRELARATGISPTTASRVKRGELHLDGNTVTEVFLATGECLCCGYNTSAAPVVTDAMVEAALMSTLGRPYPSKQMMRAALVAALEVKG